MWLFIAFLMVPLIEIALFIQIGGLIGLWPTLAIVVATAILGTWLVRAQGRLAMNDLRRSFSTLDDPSEPLAHGAMILISGALLLTPGFFTDAVGFALLAPPVRRAVFRYVAARVQVSRFEMGAAAGPDPSRVDPRSGHGRPQSPPPQRPRSGDTVIDGEYTEVPPTKPSSQKGPSGWTKS
ncbi:FxsA family protein [Cognatishimia sp. F0-27]|uniref:FxsA family protein n=1 Tax=Cognatishimia sp. F0-27 TaxID=2816855 RepID=UPI001D0C4C05|nr:FxsA family protein [Cognatishimia sp. F0-27]MCC1492445.1 FxsA family protein [Cognatishimia sp. F0-27]